MSRRNTLGNLSWITDPKPPSQETQDNLDTKPSQPSTDIQPAEPIEASTDIQPAEPIEANQEEPERPLNVDIPVSLHSRLHSVVAYDEECRSLKEIVAFILQEGLAKFPDKGPAPPSYLNRLKSFGRRAKKT